MKTKESISAYNKEYFARPYVKARAKVRNAERRGKRKEYKKTEAGREAENKYRRRRFSTDEVKNRRLIEKYGISLKQRNELFEKQGGVCAICKNTPKGSLHTDHSHSTGVVRGILCNKCNMALGLLKDNTEFLMNAIEYLKK